MRIPSVLLRYCHLRSWTCLLDSNRLWPVLLPSGVAYAGITRVTLVLTIKSVHALIIGALCSPMYQRSLPFSWWYPGFAKSRVVVTSRSSTEDLRNTCKVDFLEPTESGRTLGWTSQSFPRMILAVLTVLGSDPQTVAAQQDPEEAVAVVRESKSWNTSLAVESRHLWGEQSADCCRISYILWWCPMFFCMSIMINNEEADTLTHLSSFKALVHKEAVPVAVKSELSSILSRIHLLLSKLTNWVSSGVLWLRSNPGLNATVLCELILVQDPFYHPRGRKYPRKMVN